MARVRHGRGLLEGTLPTGYEEIDYYEFGPQMSRGFRALTVWMSLEHFGVEGHRTLMPRNVACAECLDTLDQRIGDDVREPGEVFVMTTALGEGETDRPQTVDL